EARALVTSTRHMQTAHRRKPGPPISDEATMTTRYFRHGNILTMLSVIEDPYYLSEPSVWTKRYQLAEAEVASQVLACITTYEGATPGEVPHYSPETNPFIDEMSKKYNLPRDVVLGYPETLYPEDRQKMKGR